MKKNIKVEFTVEILPHENYVRKMRATWSEFATNVEHWYKETDQEIFEKLFLGNFENINKNLNEKNS